MTDLPKTLLEIADAFSVKPINLSPIKPGEEPRLAAARHEIEVINHIKDIGFTDKIIVSTMRNWMDFALSEEKMPVNIKVSSLKSSDNAANFRALIWALTDIEMALDGIADAREDSMLLVNWLKKRNKQLEEDKQTVDKKILERDYYYFVVNKNKPTEVIINSVRGLNLVSPNANNLPYQIKWSKNKVYVKRTPSEAIQMYLECLNETRKKDWRSKFWSEIEELCTDE